MSELRIKAKNTEMDDSAESGGRCLVAGKDVYFNGTLSYRPMPSLNRSITFLRRCQS